MKTMVGILIGVMVLALLMMISRMNVLTQQVQDARSQAAAAQSQADDATQKADDTQDQADDATQKADDAQSQADDATQKADAACDALPTSLWVRSDCP